MKGILERALPEDTRISPAFFQQNQEIAELPLGRSLLFDRLGENCVLRKGMQRLCDPKSNRPELGKAQERSKVEASGLLLSVTLRGQRGSAR